MARTSNLKCRRGAVFIESLAAVLIITVGVIALITVGSTIFEVGQKTNRTGAVSSLARQMVEQTRARGFIGSAEGTTSLFYNRDGLNEASTAQGDSAYRVDRIIVSSAFDTDANGVVVPSSQALRTVTVRVFRLDTGAQVLQTGTLLCRGGL